jgi:hypothetical protein
MAQKMELNEMSFLINGGGRINENKPIILQDYVAPAFVEKGAVEIKSIAPKAITLSKKIGKTVYDVTGLFDVEAQQSALQQFKHLILANS